MERDEQLFSWINKLIVLIIFTDLIIGCATSAPELPINNTAISK